jgi:hypothetical protein
MAPWPNVIRLKKLLVFQTNTMGLTEHGFRTEAMLIRLK